MSVPDYKLSAAQLRLKYDEEESDDDLDSVDEFSLSSKKKRESKFIRHLAVMYSTRASAPGEDAVEVDEHDDRIEALTIDVSLFGGLDHAMSEPEQTYVTALLTSGDPNGLAKAAQILHGIGELAQHGTTPSVQVEKKRRMRRQNRTNTTPVRDRGGDNNGNGRAVTPTGTRPGMAGVATIINNSPGGGSSDNTASPYERRLLLRGPSRRRIEMAENHSSRHFQLGLPPGRKVDKEIRGAMIRAREIDARRRLHPLPSRMPRYACLEAFNPRFHRTAPLFFLDDEWDGSLTDAFGRPSHQVREPTSTMTKKLREAAQILHGIGELAQHGTTPSVQVEKKRRMRRQNRTNTTPVRDRGGDNNGNGRAVTPTGTRPGMAGVATIINNSPGGGSSDNTASPYERRLLLRGPSRRRIEMAENHSSRHFQLGLPPGRKVDKEIRGAMIRAREIDARRRLHPLPSRMPRYACLEAFNPRFHRTAPLFFLDDEWDGSLTDAFGRPSHQVREPTSTMTKKLREAEEDGVHNLLLSGGGSWIETHISTPRQRVVVARVSGLAGRQGIKQGDVVTHVNGEKFEGNADALLNFIGTTYQSSEIFTLVVNAEECTAEALKLRAHIV